MIKKGCGCHLQPLIIVEEPTLPEVQFENIPCPDTTLVRIENHPDEEDLTEVLVNEELVLKFKDKVYNPMLYSGYGRIFLRKNMQDSMEECPSKVNVLTLAMFLDENGQARSHTIYIVLYDYDLMGNTIFIPSNSILLFLGGSFKNGTLILNDTLVLPLAIVYEDFIKCIVTGRFKTGLMFYTDNGIKFWNGSEWKMISASSMEDFNEIIAELLLNVLTLLTNVNNLGETDQLLSQLLAGKANLLHNHALRDVTGLEDALGRKLSANSIKINGTYLTDGIILNIGSDGSVLSLPVASYNDLGGIKIGYRNQGDNKAIQLDADNRAFVNVPSYNDNALKTRISSIETRLDSGDIVERFSEITLDIDLISATVSAISRSISPDGTLTIEQLSTELHSYVNLQVGTAVNSITSKWVYQHDNDVLWVVSGLKTSASSDYTSFAEMYAENNRNIRASITASVTEAMSQVTISADLINFDGNTNWMEFLNSLYFTPAGSTHGVSWGDHGVKITSDEIIVYNGSYENWNPERYVSIKNGLNTGIELLDTETNVHAHFNISRVEDQEEPNITLDNTLLDSILTAKFILFNGNDEDETVAKITSDSIKVSDSNDANLTKILAGNIICKDEDVTITVQFGKIKFVDNSDNTNLLEFGLNTTNFSGTFTTLDNKTVTVKEGIITSVTN